MPHFSVLARFVFQHTAARRRLGVFLVRHLVVLRRFNTQPPEGGWCGLRLRCLVVVVSTHSRPKAAGFYEVMTATDLWWFQHTAARRRLVAIVCTLRFAKRFQHTAARRRLGVISLAMSVSKKVSTHSRPKAAGVPCTGSSLPFIVSTHSRPKAAGKLAKKCV